VRRFLAALLERPGTKLVALLLALGTWVAVRSEETTDVTLTVAVVAVLDEGLEIVGDLPDSVQVVVSAQFRELLKLRGSPPVVRRRFDQEAPRRHRVTLEPPDVEFPAGVVATARAVRPSSFLIAVQSRGAGR
jgi:hypothetical protein